jgi:hypothetical protein
MGRRRGSRSSVKCKEVRHLGGWGGAHEVILNHQHAEPLAEIQRVDPDSFTCIELSHQPVSQRELDVAGHQSRSKSALMHLVEFMF